MLSTNPIKWPVSEVFDIHRALVTKLFLMGGTLRTVQLDQEMPPHTSTDLALRLSHLLHVFSVNLLISVKNTGHQWRVWLSWCSLANKKKNRNIQGGVRLEEQASTVDIGHSIRAVTLGHLREVSFLPSSLPSTPKTLLVRILSPSEVFCGFDDT